MAIGIAVAAAALFLGVAAAFLAARTATRRSSVNDSLHRLLHLGSDMKSTDRIADRVERVAAAHGFLSFDRCLDAAVRLYAPHNHPPSPHAAARACEDLDSIVAEAAPQGHEAFEDMVDARVEWLETRAGPCALWERGTASDGALEVEPDRNKAPEGVCACRTDLGCCASPVVPDTSAPHLRILGIVLPSRSRVR